MGQQRLEAIDGPEVGVSVHGAPVRTIGSVLVVAILAVVAFAAGRSVATLLGADTIDAAAGGEPAQQPVQSTGASPVADDVVATDSDPNSNPSTGDAFDTDPASSADRSGRLRFERFDEPTKLVGEVGGSPDNTIDLDTSILGQSPTAALVGDLVLAGPAGSTVSIGPGDAPEDAIRFTVPAVGRLEVPHLVMSTGGASRILISADAPTGVTLTGHGRYVAAEDGLATAGRFVATGSQRLGSLETATDGRRLVISLDQEPGIDGPSIGTAVIRLNANVGRGGGMLTLHDGTAITWPAPPIADLMKSGSALVTVAPNERGEIALEYHGGAVVTADLVGYYTSAAAPRSDRGLLVLAERPEMLTAEIDSENGIDVRTIARGGTDGVGLDGPLLVTLEAQNGSTRGAIGIGFGADASGSNGAFDLAPGQARASTEWIGPSPSAANVHGPDGAILRFWKVGAFT